MARSFLIVHLFNIFVFTSTKAIISPPNEEAAKLANDFEEWRQTRKEFIDSMKHPMGLPHFDCPLPTYPTPESIDQLHPSHVDVLAALGDSVSVAQGAKSSSVSDIFEKYPGVNFVTGSDVAIDEQATLFNIFRQFSPRIKGGSSNRIQKFYDFNFAVPGSFAFQLPGQAQKLSKTLGSRLRGDNLKTWKVINILIGHNDMCHICTNQTIHSPETFGNSLRSTLKIIKANIPNVFVNIMPPINVDILSVTRNTTDYCVFSHKNACPCLLELTSEQFTELKSQFDQQLDTVVREFQDPETSNFSVAIAPAMNLAAIPLLGDVPNLAYVALDCFHLSDIVHDIMAKQLWKGLFEPVGRKSVTTQFSVGYDRFVCPPVECPFIRTSGNSESCQPLEAMRLLQTTEMEVDSSQRLGVFITMGFFVIGSILIGLFVRASLRRPSPELSDERTQLLPLPIRADLNDNIF